MAEDKESEAGEETGGGKKKLLIIILIAVVLLVGAGVAAFFLLSGDDEAADDEAAAEQTESKEEPEALPEGDPTYVQMKPQFVVNLPPGGPAKMLQLGVSVLTRYGEVAEFIDNNDPMLRHHIIDLLEQQPGQELLTLEGKQGLQTKILELLREKMQQMNQAGEIEGVYFTEFVLQ